MIRNPSNYYASIVNFRILICFFIFTGLIIYGCSVSKQNITSGDIVIKLPGEIADSKQEFSSMYLKDDAVWLMPQYPDSLNHSIYSIEKQAIEDAINSGSIIKEFGRISVNGLKNFKDRIGGSYEGLEAVVVIGNKVFFTIETKPPNKNCYLIRGTLQGDQIIIDNNRLYVLPKLKMLTNAGFEAMEYLPEKGKLLLFFEYNKADIGSKALLVDTSLTGKADTMLFQPLMYRLTDVTVSGNKLLGINYHYNRSRVERPEYIGADSLFVEPDLEGKTIKEASMSRIIEIKIGNGLTWKSKKVIEISDGIIANNWEGIVPFKKGVLLVSDEYSKTVLKYLKL
ncbi:MAG: hypothetical protein EOO89_20575 [Pedobacter sp.]|nr:MAG: hypothetical protein EOO89_20575 [Pedobacter sp.]